MKNIEINMNPFVGLTLWIALVILKITGVVGLGWFWVITGFIWIPLLTAMSVFVVLIAIYMIGMIIK